MVFNGLADYLAALLSGISGKFIMSINDVPKIWDLLQDFHIGEVAHSYATPGTRPKKEVVELLILNYDP